MLEKSIIHRGFLTAGSAILCSIALLIMLFNIVMCGEVKGRKKVTQWSLISCTCGTNYSRSWWCMWRANAVYFTECHKIQGNTALPDINKPSNRLVICFCCLTYLLCADLRGTFSQSLRRPRRTARSKTPEKIIIRSQKIWCWRHDWSNNASAKLHSTFFPNSHAHTCLFHIPKLYKMSNRKVVIITGGNTGIGFETAKALFGKGFHVIIGEFTCVYCKRALFLHISLQHADLKQKLKRQ